METTQQQFERVLSLESFKGLKAILDGLAKDRDAAREAVKAAKSYEELLAKLGYQLTLIKQVHVQDAYSRVGRAGGVKAVFSYYDIPSQSSFPTLANFDATATTTPKAAAFFSKMLASLQKQLT